MDINLTIDIQNPYVYYHKHFVIDTNISTNIAGYTYIYINRQSSLYKEHPELVPIYERTLQIANEIVDVQNIKLNLTFNINC